MRIVGYATLSGPPDVGEVSIHQRRPSLCLSICLVIEAKSGKVLTLIFQGKAVIETGPFADILIYLQGRQVG